MRKAPRAQQAVSEDFLNFRLAHLSDAHIGPIPRPNLAELLGKRVTGYVNWLYKRGDQHDMGVLGKIVADIKAQAPDHVVMTGDIVNIGLPGEIALAKDWLASLGAPGDVSFTPGNHDAYVASVTRSRSRRFRALDEQRERRRRLSLFAPARRRRADRSRHRRADGAFRRFRAGSGRRSWRRSRDLLERAKAEGLARVVCLHHPPHVGGARRLRGLEDAAEFESVIARHGAELILHGHNHKPSLHRLPGPGAGDASRRRRVGLGAARRALSGRRL